MSRKHKSQAYKRLPNTYTLRNNGNVEDTQTLYISSGLAYEYQVEELFESALKDAQTMTNVFGENFNCDIRVNVVKDHEGFYKGYGFVWLSSPEFYNALLGNNIDGSPRIEWYEDPDAKIPIATEEKPKSNSWADMIDEEPIKLKRDLPPILSLKKFKYDEQQEPHVPNSQEEGVICISPAFITPDSIDTYSLSPDVIFARNVPPQIDFLYKIFSPYSKSNTNYPKITIKKSKNPKRKTGVYNAVIKYDPGTYDAQFALLMTRKIHVKNGEKDYLISSYYDKTYMY